MPEAKKEVKKKCFKIYPKWDTPYTFQNRFGFLMHMNFQFHFACFKIHISSCIQVVICIFIMYMRIRGK